MRVLAADSAVAASTAYLYRVRAIGPGGSSDYSSPDLATTVIFSEDPLLPGQTSVRAAHMAEMREAVTAVMTTAGLPPPSWADPSITAGVTPVRATPILQLRDSLTSALAALGLPSPSFSRPIAPALTINAADFQEIRDAVK